MSGPPGLKRCLIAYATRSRQYLWQVELPATASIAEALAAARRAGAEQELGAGFPWETAVVGVFGTVRQRTDVCADGERIEIYRPLTRDPRERRRERVQRERRSYRQPRTR
jgi:putative ubiquitin-RnfH superfamily antitoxin RatB of RatAB toxin-antitoxin module